MDEVGTAGENTGPDRGADGKTTHSATLERITIKARFIKTLHMHLFKGFDESCPSKRPTPHPARLLVADMATIWGPWPEAMSLESADSRMAPRLPSPTMCTSSTVTHASSPVGEKDSRGGNKVRPRRGSSVQRFLSREIHNPSEHLLFAAPTLQKTGQFPGRCTPCNRPRTEPSVGRQTIKDAVALFDGAHSDVFAAAGQWHGGTVKYLRKPFPN